MLCRFINFVFSLSWWIVSREDLKISEEKIMSTIAQFVAKQNAIADRQDKAIAALQADIGTLNGLISELQNSIGVITPEDQALLDSLEARGNVIADKLDALDALTPDKVVVVQPPVEVVTEPEVVDPPVVVEETPAVVELPPVVEPPSVLEEPPIA
jgi:hypothetical protein